MKNLKGKKLLVIGGAFQHCKVVEAAQKRGAEVYVTDYLEPKDAPAKQIADHYWMHNISDIDGIVNDSRKAGIDGVIALCLDACQRPYQKVCEKLGVPCFGNAEQFHILTDKNAFKQCCKKYGVDVIPEYQISDFADSDTCSSNVQFPILIKPCDSRGSRGQTICKTFEQALKAIEFARSESSNGEIVIEKYMGSSNDFSMSYVMLDGKAYLTRTGNRYLGTKEDKLDKLAIAGTSPSAYTDLYLEKVDARVVNMLQGIGLKTAPVFMQGFVDGNTVRFYDPGLRFPGIEYERMYETICGINPIDALLEFALTGTVSPEFAEMQDTVRLNGKVAVDLLVAVRPGTITAIHGMEQIKNDPCVVSAFAKYKIGDTVGEHWNVNQRFCEIDIVCDSTKAMQTKINWIYDTLKVENASGENLVFAKFDLSALKTKGEK